MHAQQPKLPQPLAGLKVVEFTHMVMGPTCGMVLADLGAEVIKVEPIDGDRTRTLLGAGIGFFPMFNRNKKSIQIDLHTPAGAAAARQLAASADVVAENFKPGTMAKYGLDYASLSKGNPKLIYASLKGFLPGPYDHRTALDEVVQMMGGLAYMTGRPGDPLRAGSSVNDIMGGMFGAIAILGALIQRGISGRGMEVQSALFENNVFLVGQHMLQYAITGKPAAPMPARISPWAIYDVFTVKDGEQIFLAAVSDAQWLTFCDALGFDDLKADPALKSNNDRVHARPHAAARAEPAPAGLQRCRAVATLRGRRPAVRADHEARATARRSAPRQHRRPGRHHAHRRRARRPACEDHAVPVHARRPAPRRAHESAQARRAHARSAGGDRHRGTRDRCAGRKSRRGLSRTHCKPKETSP